MGLSEELLSGMTHDMRSPLFTILGYLNLLQRQLGESAAPKTLEYIRLAREASQRLTGMVEEMLDIMRSSEGSLAMRMEPVPLNHLFKRLWDNFHVRAAEKQINLRMALKGSDDICAWADARLIERALDNLLGNALKFTPQNGQITLTGSVIQGQVTLEVADSGRGMSPEVQTRLFQTSSPMMPADRFTGFGLGLPIVKFIVEAHRAHIQVFSEEGQGSRFIISMPERTDPLLNAASIPATVEQAPPLTLNEGPLQP